MLFQPWKRCSNIDGGLKREEAQMVAVEDMLEIDITLKDEMLS